MRKYYTFNEDIVFRRVATRYDLNVAKLMRIVARYIKYRHDVHFTMELGHMAEDMEPFIKNELKPTIQELCRLYDSRPLTIAIDSRNRVRLYVKNLPGDEDGV